MQNALYALCENCVLEYSNSRHLSKYIQTHHIDYYITLYYFSNTWTQLLNTFTPKYDLICTLFS